ncbi:MAG TPA: lysoplasmalogenase [Anaerolineae bacterium]|nr:lysoplasmalogenase [Anaerolineae bacterium]
MTSNPIVDLGLIAIPVLLLMAFIFGKYNPERTRRTLKPLRMSTSFVAVLIALVVWASSTRLAGAAPWFFFGMVFGFLGDLILADVIPLPRRMISGIIAFGVGHICYVIGFINVAATLGLSNPITGSLFWVVYVLASSFLWVVFINNPTKSRTLNIGSLIYAWLISMMAGAAGGLALQDPRFTLTAIGGALFLLSDLILGNRELRDNGWFLVHDVVWVLYIAGQTLIVTTGMRV